MRGNIARRRLRHIFFGGVLSAVAMGAAGCSGDTSRIGDNPNANPYASRAPSYQQSSVPAQPVRAAAVERQPLPQTQYAPPQYAQPQYAPPPQYPPPQYAQPDYPPPEYGQPQYTRSRYTPPQYTPPQSAPPQYEQPAPPMRPVSGAAVAGAKVAHAAAPRMPAAAAAPSTPAPAVASQAPAAAAAASPVPAPAVTTGSSAQTLLPAPPVHTVVSGDTLGRVAYKYRVKVKDLAVANGIQPDTRLKVGMQLTVPVKVVPAPPGAQPAKPALAQTRPPAAGAPHASAPVAAAPGKLAASEPAANVRMASPAETSPEEASLNAPNGTPAFRWPARGRVINNFGARVNGSANDGIDLAVPEGTQVRAADDGVVAYAGNELKGYGNLVLVRHSNGFVTAYANASELLVKRNDQVHKGQVILKSGQTGNATAPQLHFEVRKNSAPVDPMQFLPSDKTASAPL